MNKPWRKLYTDKLNLLNSTNKFKLIIHYTKFKRITFIVKQLQIPLNLFETRQM